MNDTNNSFMQSNCNHIIVIDSTFCRTSSYSKYDEEFYNALLTLICRLVLDLITRVMAAVKCSLSSHFKFYIAAHTYFASFATVYSYIVLQLYLKSVLLVVTICVVCDVRHSAAHLGEIQK